MEKRRVVITGRGIVSSIGWDITAITNALKKGMSGIGINHIYQELGLRSHVSGLFTDPITMIQEGYPMGKKIIRHMSPGAAYGYIAMQDAVFESMISQDTLSDPATGLIIGSGGGSPASAIEVAQKLETGRYKRISPFASGRCMASSISANLATIFGIRGLSYTISSACATSAHAIGEAYEKIAYGKLDTVICGGCDENDVYVAASFDRAGALSSAFNDRPLSASRPYDRDRDGFVISAGAGILVLEELDHAYERGATIIAEVIGYGATSDGYDMTKPSGKGAVRCMNMALKDARDINPTHIDYINTHGTSTPVGDLTELTAIKEVFGSDIPLISSTKGLTGHALGAAGVHEVIYCLSMMENGFIAASANIENIDPKAASYPIVQETKKDQINIVMSNSFGFGGTNATLLIEKIDI